MQEGELQHKKLATFISFLNVHMTITHTAAITQHDCVKKRNFTICHIHRFKLQFPI